MDLEILYKEEDKELSVRYKGVVVFKEESGDLQAYVPMLEWEDMIDRLYILTKGASKAASLVKSQANAKKSEASKSSWIKRMAERWGFNV